MDKTNILDYLKDHYQEFKTKYNIEQIGLFGSYARDEATKDSDIDIFVKMPPKLFDIVAIKDDLEETFQTKVDIIREHKNMKPLLIEMIHKHLIYA